MNSPGTSDLTLMIADLRHGKQEAAERLAPLVYQELRRLARYYLSQENPNHTLQATALVHEFWLRLFSEEAPGCNNRAEFFQIAVRQMRQILVEHARARQAGKRLGQRERIPLEEATPVIHPREVDLLALEQALERMERLYPRTCQVVELRFFGGLTVKETALTMGVSVTTVKQEWEFAGTWLYTRMASQVRDSSQ
jgi:RNA polymerase sigma factor (TIGR02999 family)